MNAHPKPNLDLLRRVLRQIDQHPETWNQEVYAEKTLCGTRFCVAGHAVVMSGLEIDWMEYSHNSDGIAANACRIKNRRHIDDVAQELLGLKGNELLCLFSGRNSREDIEKVAKRIAKRAGERLWPK